MRRKIIFQALLAMMFVACGGSDDVITPAPPVPDPPQPKAEVAIAFSGSLGEGESESHARTRATTNPLSATHQTFYAWAYKNPASGNTETVMQNYTVNWQENSIGSTTTNSRGWEYVNQQPSGTVQSIKYWDFSASDYRFFGYAGSGVVVTPPSTSVSFSFSVDATTANLESLTSSTPLYSKLWCNTGDVIASDIQPVQLVFLQPYVKVRFLFRQSEPPETIFTLSGITFGPTPPDPPAVAKTIALTGTFTVTYPLSGTPTEETWEVAPTSQGAEANKDYLTAFTEDYYVFSEDGFNREDVPATKAGEKKWYTVLPAKDQGTYTLTVFVNGEERNVIVPAQYMNWQSGYEYTYVFKITERGTVELLGLKSAFVPWYTNDEEHPIYNW